MPRIARLCSSASICSGTRGLPRGTGAPPWTTKDAERTWKPRVDMSRAGKPTDPTLQRNVSQAHRTAMAVSAGYVWINEVSKHFLGAPFGGTKQSGFGREESIEELLSFTQEKNIHVKLRRSGDPA